MARVIQLGLGVFIISLGAKGPPSSGKPMGVITNLEQMKASTLGKVKDFVKRAMRKSTSCLPLDQV
jgi:hypothetical protein